MTASPAPAAQKRGFFRRLFNPSFTDFITLQVLSVLYIIAMVLIGLSALIGIVGAIAAAFDRNGSPVLILLIVPILLGSLLLLVFVRLSMELTAVIFRIGQNTTALVRSGGFDSAYGPYQPQGYSPQAGPGTYSAQPEHVRFPAEQPQPPQQGQSWMVASAEQYPQGQDAAQVQYTQEVWTPETER